MRDVRILVTSHVNYHKKTLPVLIPPLVGAGIKQEDILIVIGGSEEYCHTSVGFTPARYVKENLFDWTAFYSLATDAPLIQPDYWFFLPDTSYVGPNFKRDMMSFHGQPDGIRLLELTRCGSNIGLYSAGLLERQRDRILDFSRECYGLDTLGRKRLAVLAEDQLLAGPGIGHYQLRADEQNLGTGTPYGGETRTLFRYPAIDLFRWKANHTTVEEATTVNP